MATQSTGMTGAVQPARTSRRFTLWHLSLILVLIGVGISGYLSYTELTSTEIVCAEGEAFNCEVVQSSAYSKLMGIPVAYLGVASYLLIGVLLLLEPRVGLLREYGIMIVFGIVLFGWIYSMYLVYVQAALLQAFCVWCLGHEFNMTVLFIVSGLRLWKFLSKPLDTAG